jgi:phosphopantothenoylcysteine decarboxylase/phosphopantothenate--cysteine ligase
MFEAKRITLGVTGSIAAYKAAEIASALTNAGHIVRVIMTAHAVEFIAPITFETLTHQKVLVDMFADEDHRLVSHIERGTKDDLLLIAPATYNIIGKAAQGIADDLLSSVLAAADPHKVIFAPAMNVNMYANPACQANIKTLTERGCQFIEPEEGMLACGVIGKGRLARVPAILDAVEAHFRPKPLAGKKVLITAGATREYLDPIRFLSNASSGQMGVALARACRHYGAEVTLVLANSQLDAQGVHVIRVDTVADLYAAARTAFPQCDILFASAAVSDYKPVQRSPGKIKKTAGNLVVEFEPNTDVLKELSKIRQHQTLIGFAAESEDLIENARGKLQRKNLDFIIANTLDNFARTSGKVWLVDADSTVELPELPKPDLAFAILDALLKGKQA